MQRHRTQSEIDQWTTHDRLTFRTTFYSPPWFFGVFLRGLLYKRYTVLEEVEKTKKETPQLIWLYKESTRLRPSRVIRVVTLHRLTHHYLSHSSYRVVGTILNPYKDFSWWRKYVYWFMKRKLLTVKLYRISQPDFFSYNPKTPILLGSRVNRRPLSVSKPLNPHPIINVDK